MLNRLQRIFFPLIGLRWPRQAVTLLLPITLVLLFWPYQSRANLAGSFGLGAGAVGSAGARAAFVNDWSAAYYNPAGLTAPMLQNKHTKTAPSTYHNQVGLGLFYQQPLLVIRPSNPASNQAKQNANLGENVPGYGGLNIGLVVDLRQLVYIPKNLPVKLGLGIAQPGFGTDIIQITETNQKFYNFQNVGRNAARPNILVGLGAQLWPDRLSLGVGARNLANLDGNIKLKVTSLDPNSAPESETQLKVKLRPVLLAGLQYRQPLVRRHELYMGLNYRAENQIKADLDVLASIPVANLTTLVNARAQILTLYDPHTVVWGLGYKYNQYKLETDLEWQQWSGFRLSETRQVHEQAPRFADIVILRISAEGPLKIPGLKSKLLDLQLRLGYGYVPPFTPDQTQASNYLDNPKHILAIGLSKMFRNNSFFLTNVKLDWGLQWQIWQSRLTRKQTRYSLPDGSLQPDYSYGGDIIVTSVSVTLML